jgi:3-deoxy-7-phosphoheptulonate synthase
VIGVIGQEGKILVQPLGAFPGVEQVVPIMKPYKLASREFKADDSVIDLGDGVTIGGKKVVVMAGPCSVEGYDMLLETAKKVKKAGATILRGGAFKPRTSPYSFQGLGEEGLKYLRDAANATGMKVVTEVMDTRQVEKVCELSDMLQIGARNMQNFDLLKLVGDSKKPVLLKRGLSSTMKELFLSAEYILSRGNFKVVLCERGIRTFETDVRNTFDLSAVSVTKHLTHLPIIADPSHATGISAYVPSMAKAALASGADGLMIEVHPNPEEAWSDGPQSLTPDQFTKLMGELRPLAQALGREI